MQILIPRLPDSLILTKYESIANALAKGEWRVDAGGENWQMFSITSKVGEKDPWNKNGVAAQLLAGSGIAATSFHLQIDGRPVVQIARQNAQSRDHLTIQQSWFAGGDNNEQIRLDFARACDAIGAQFGVAMFGPGKPSDSTDEISQFVTARDEGLARLEELYSRLTRGIIEDRERSAAELLRKEKDLEKQAVDRRAAFEVEKKAGEAALAEKAAALETRLKAVDNRDEKIVRRDIRNQLKQEIKSRQSKFELTPGTRRMRLPVIVAVSLLAILLGVGFYYYTVELIALVAANKVPEGYVLATMIARQLLIGVALGGTVWFFIHWQNQWSQRHAEEEFAVKRLELDLDRASWVVELAMEWSKEKHGQELPDPILTQLTKNLFNDKEAKTGPDRADMLSALLGASTKADIGLGDMKFSVDRKGAKRLKRELDGDSKD